MIYAILISLLLVVQALVIISGADVRELTLDQGANIAWGNITVTIEPPFAQKSSAVFEYMGIETFDSLPQRTLIRQPTNFGGLSDISAIYRTASISPRDAFGGAGGVGNYIKTGGTNAGLAFSKTGAHGLNYFGFWLSAFEGTGRMDLSLNNRVLIELQFSRLLDLVNQEPTYFGNPTFNPRVNMGQPYVFVNFFFHEPYTFDHVNFALWTTTLTNSDNHTAGYFLKESGIVVEEGAVLPEFPTTTTTRATTAGALPTGAFVAIGAAGGGAIAGAGLLAYYALNRNATDSSWSDASFAGEGERLS